MKSVHEFILDNWNKTIHAPKENIPYPYTVPCIDEGFVNFFYWDTYFTNIGLLTDGLTGQAKNNILVMNHFLETLGFIPNADHILGNTQPPLFTRAVYDYVEKTNDLELLRRVKDSMLKEYAFFDKNRKTPIGLYHYSAHASDDALMWYYNEFKRRTGSYSDEEKALDPVLYARSMVGIAESGWDFNVRFQCGDVKFASYRFAHLDLNCLLYDAFVKASQLFNQIDEPILSLQMKGKAEALKKLIQRYLYDEKDHIYKDYNFTDHTFSSVISIASLYPYAFGISEELASAKKVLKSLMLPYGVSTAPYRGEVTYYQWDYPAMWPPTTYFAYLAFLNMGDKDTAEEIKTKFVTTLESVYQESGKLWEKYDAKTGKVSVTSEYQTPPMMGWTAGVYDYFLTH